MTYQFKTLRELKNYSTITITQDIDEIWKNLSQNNKSIELYLPLKEFVIKDGRTIDNMVMYYYIKDNNDSWILELNILDKNTYKYNNMSAYKITNKNNDINFKVLSHEGNKFFNDSVNNGIEHIKQEFTMLLSCIIYTKDNPSISIRKKSLSKKSNDKIHNSNKTQTDKSTHIVKLGEKIIYTLDTNNSDDAKTFKKKYQRHVESWEVMGHDRKLKNGKIIHVKPYKKGDGKTTKKDYKL